jgi:hypothetical protein
MAETFNRTSQTLSTTSATDIYQAPASNASDRAIVLSVLVCNISTLTVPSVSLTVTDSSNNVQSTLISALPIPVSSSLEAVVNKYILKSGEKIRATSTSANVLSLTVSALEVTA